ncbi:hypothetical protein [Micromonospora sp. NBC_01412]|uniref:hypothetical protein n=1 Tax=Micromonospora sp. NBC_01412 TaxID=2903590 RepID=UPI00324A736C
MSGVRQIWRQVTRLAVAAGLACLGIVYFLATLLTAGLSLLGVGLPLRDCDDDHRRVRAVLTQLDA